MVQHFERGETLVEQLPVERLGESRGVVVFEIEPDHQAAPADLADAVRLDRSQRGQQLLAYGRVGLLSPDSGMGMPLLAESADDEDAAGE